MPANLAIRRSPVALATRSISARPATWRESDRSIEAIAATETPVRCEIYDYERRGWALYDEVIDVAGMSDDDIAGYVGCPVLDAHSTRSAHDIVGVIVEARREGTELIVRFSIDETEPAILSKVRSGTIRKVSIGYKRKAGAVITEREGNVPLRRQPVEPAELSLVAVGADANAVTRSAESVRHLADPAPAETQEDPMSVNVDAIRSATAGLATAVAALQAAVAETPAPATGAEGARSETTTVVETRAAPAPVVQAQGQTQAPAPVAGQRSAEDEAVITGYRGIAATAGRSDEFEAFVRGGRSIAQLGDLASGYVSTTSAQTNGVVINGGGQRAEQFMSHDEAINGGQRSGDPIAALAAAIANLGQR